MEYKFIGTEDDLEKYGYAINKHKDFTLHATKSLNDGTEEQIFIGLKDGLYPTNEITYDISFDEMKVEHIQDLIDAKLVEVIA